MAADNVSLGALLSDRHAARPRGVPKIEVTFDIDANGILNVSPGPGHWKTREAHDHGAQRMEQVKIDQAIATRRPRGGDRRRASSSTCGIC